MVAAAIWGLTVDLSSASSGQLHGMGMHTHDVRTTDIN